MSIGTITLEPSYSAPGVNLMYLPEANILAGDPYIAEASADNNNIKRNVNIHDGLIDDDIRVDSDS